MPAGCHNAAAQAVVAAWVVETAAVTAAVSAVEVGGNRT
jgi:hypothetical protein